ncbi:hypothetical protein [Nocardiopsis nanhaiensis]
MLVIIVVLVLVLSNLGSSGGSGSSEPSPPDLPDLELEEPGGMGDDQADAEESDEEYGEGHAFEALDFPDVTQPDGTGHDCADFSDALSDLGPSGYESDVDCVWRSAGSWSTADLDDGEHTRRLIMHINDAGHSTGAEQYNRHLNGLIMPADATLYEVPVGEHGHVYFDEIGANLEMNLTFSDGTNLVEIALEGRYWDSSGSEADFFQADEEELIEEMGDIVDAVNS